MSTGDWLNWLKLKPDVEFQYGRRLGEFNGMSSQSHLPHCRVLPPGKFNVMIPEQRITLQGAATGQIKWYVISKPGSRTWAFLRTHYGPLKSKMAEISHLGC